MDEEKKMMIEKLKRLANSLQTMESDMLDMMGSIMKIGREVMEAIDRLESKQPSPEPASGPAGRRIEEEE